MPGEEDDDEIEDLVEKVAPEDPPEFPGNTSPKASKDDDTGRFYPTVEEVIGIHDDIIEEDPNAEPGLPDRGQIEFILEHVQYGSYGEGPATVHEVAFQLMRLLAANHPFVDGNKRTALATAVHFYFWNGYDLQYQEELESMLILISIREDFIDDSVAVEYLEGITEPLEFDQIFEFFVVLSEIAESITTHMNIGVGTDEENPENP